MPITRSIVTALITLLFFAFSVCCADAPAATDPAPRMSYLDNGVIRLGVDLNLGGAITWLSKSGDSANMVNSSDWGRQIQMSFYAGPVPFTPEGKQPAPEWRGLGWNPIQCGDYFKNRAKVLDVRNDGKEIYIKCTPMQWPLDNVPGDCVFESTLKLDGNTVHASCRLINHRADATQYPARLQELPALYSNGPWWKLMTYTGDKPFTNAALAQIPAKMPWSQWNATENWAALVNEKNQGLGIWEPGTNLFSGGFNGKPGDGGPKDNPCGYITPNHADILDHNIEYNYSYVLILGSLDEIRKYVYDHAQRPSPPEYHFAADRQHWTFHDAVDSGWPIRGQMDVRAAGLDPYLVGPLTFWQSADAPKIWIEAAFENTKPLARLRFRSFDDKDFNRLKMVVFPVVADGKYRVYEVDLSASEQYAGAMTRLRLDPILIPGTEGQVRLKSISFRKPAEK